ncbi:nuclear mRNA export, poly(A)+RNA binding protein [Mortierella sp. AD010]|nr:nuclear mRNA export, poly(A)+RNA binding protein [Mortierella sp. AD010]
MMPGRGRFGGRGGRNGNNDRDQNDGAAAVTGNTEIGFFTNRRGGGGGGGGGGGPVRDSNRRNRRGGVRSSVALPPRPGRGEDMDGDLNMGGEKKNFSPYQRPGRNTRSSAATQSDPAGAVVVFVRTQEGQSLATDSELYDFLSRKAQPTKINITKKSSNEMTGAVSFSVDNIAQGKAVRALSGIRYKKQKLIINTTQDEKIFGSSSSTGLEIRPSTSSGSVNRGTIESIREFLRSRYNGGFLNLENMAKDEILRNARIFPPGNTKGRSDVGAVMMKAASEMFPETVTISFASNRLTSLQPISSVAQFFPNLQNLSLKDNNIYNYKELEHLSGKKLPNLRELILLDNPIRDKDIQRNNDDLTYRSEVTKLFPSITILDQTPVAPKITFGLGDLTKNDIKPALPAPIKGNFFDNPATQATVLEFLASYLKLFDTNRSLLEHAYDNNATFSYVVMPLQSPLQRSRGKPADNWTGYNSQSRNLSRIKDLGQRTTRMYFGSRDIIQQGLMKFPETKHDLTDASKVSVDAWQTGGLLPSVCIYIMLHGEFEEVRRGSRDGPSKSFDRSFIIAPAPAGSSAALNGWKCIIISDQLTLRGYNGSAAWKPEKDTTVTPSNAAPAAGPSSAFTPSLSAAVAAVAASVNQQAPMEGVSPEQHAKAQELQKLTGLNYPYALQCLMASGWDIPKGVALVNENRANIPQDAWQQPAF